MSDKRLTQQRAAYTFAEFANLFGKERTWTYRLANKKKIAVVKGYGSALIPASEVERLSSALGAPETPNFHVPNPVCRTKTSK